MIWSNDEPKPSSMEEFVRNRYGSFAISFNIVPICLPTEKMLVLSYENDRASNYEHIRLRFVLLSSAHASCSRRLNDSRQERTVAPGTVILP